MKVLALSLILLGATAPAADVLTVDDSGGKQFTDIQPAIDTAQDGDVVLLWTGHYGPIEIDGKAVSVIARGLPCSAVSITVRNLPPGNSITLKGLSLGGYPDTPSLRLLNNAAPIWVDDVRMSAIGTGFTKSSQAQVRNCADVVFVRCGFNALEATGLGDGMAGLWATDSRVTLYRTSAWGGAGNPGLAISEGGDGGAGIRASNCDLFLGDVNCLGGDGGSGSLPSCGPGDGGAALWLAGVGNVVHVVDIELEPGVAGASSSCPPAADGLPIQDDGIGTQFVAWPGKVPSLGTASASYIEGGLANVQVDFMPLDHLLFVVVGGTPGTWTLPALFGRVVVDPVGAVHAVGPNPAPFFWVVQLPELPLGVDSRIFYLQPVSVDPATGAAILGTPLGLNVVDQTFF